MTLEFNPDDLSARSLQLVLLQADEWSCTPTEAMTRLLDGLAESAGFEVGKKKKGSEEDPSDREAA